MRIRRLLFFLAPVFFGATSLHAAFGPAPRCFPPEALQAKAETVDVMLPITELGPAIPNYDARDRDYLIRTIAFEASGEPEEGKAAVAFVILNRERSGRWGDNIEEVVTQPWQFEPWMTRRSEMEKLSRDDPRYESAASIADAVLSGQMPDPTVGATHFLNPVVARQRRGGSLPSWARGDGKPIGRHTFYSPSEGGAEPATLTMSVSVNPLPCGRIEEKRRNTQLETDRVFVRWPLAEMRPLLKRSRPPRTVTAMNSVRVCPSRSHLDLITQAKIASRQVQPAISHGTQSEELRQLYWLWALLPF